MTEDLEAKLQEFEEWLVEERYANKTILNTRQSLRYASQSCNLDDQDSIKRFVNETERKKGNQTANEYIKSFNRYFKFKGWKQLKYFKEYSSFVIKVCTHEERDRLLRAASETGARERAIFYVLFGTGVRLQELTDLKVSDIDFQKGMIKVKGKGQKRRQTNLPNEAAGALREYLSSRVIPKEEFARAYVFITRHGRMNYDYMRSRIERVALKAGVKFHAHMARHTYATELLKQGVDVYYVSRLLGHEKLTSTQIYLHPKQEDAINRTRRVRFFEVQDGLEMTLRPEREVYVPPPMDLIDDLNLLGFGEAME